MLHHARRPGGRTAFIDIEIINGLRDVKKHVEEMMEAMNYYRMVKSEAGKAAGRLSRMRPTGPGNYPEWAVAQDYLNKLSLSEDDEYVHSFDEILKAGKLSIDSMAKDLYG